MNKDGGYRLPEVIDPERICIEVHVPNDFNHLLAFWAQLEGLGSAINWGNDDAHTALDVAEVWRDVYRITRDNYFNGGCGMACADDMCDKLDKIIEILQGPFEFRYKGVGIPDFSGGPCAPDFFDHDTDETDPEVLAQRRQALCITVERYIKALMLGSLIDMGAPEFLVDFLESNLLSDIPTSLKKLTVHYPVAFEGLAIFYGIASAVLSFDALVCIMLGALEGEKNNTFSNFKNAMPLTSEGLDALLVPLLGLIRASNQNKDNYSQFNIALNDAHSEDLAAYECPCAPPPPEGCETITLRNASPVIFPDTVLTNVVGNTWRIQNPSTDTTGFGVCGASIEDENGCCFDTIPNPEGYGSQGTAQYQMFFCDGTNSGVQPGGGGGECLIKFSWDQGNSTPVDTYVTVIPHVGDIC